MQKIAILTDSACDIPPELAEQYGIHIMNFTITVDGKSFEERVDFTPSQYYQMLREAQGSASTAHITMFQFLEVYQSYAQRGYTDLIHVTINASGSATNDAAHMACRQFRQENPDSGLTVHIVDSHTYSFAYGWCLCQAAEMIAQRNDAKTIVSFLEHRFGQMEIALAAYTLKYIKQSGRISAAAAFAGEVLGLRPIITLIDGQSKVVQKVRGDQKVLPALTQLMAQRMQKGAEYCVGITDYSDPKEVTRVCKEVIGYPPKLFFQLGSAVSTNTGPDAIGFVYLGEDRPR